MLLRDQLYTGTTDVPEHGVRGKRRDQRFQQLFFPEGIAFDGSAFVGTAATAPAFRYLRGVGKGK
jgi:hypothetical protein